MNCLYCSKELIKYHQDTYCSLKCQANHRHNTKIKLWINGKDKGYTGSSVKIKPFVRRFIVDKFGNKCSKCSWSKVHPITNKVPLEVNHIDGNAKNCKEENLELLCPNCHSLTSNFRNLNKNKSKRQR